MGEETVLNYRLFGREMYEPENALFLSLTGLSLKNPIL
jgi:hypothetical protein